MKEENCCVICLQKLSSPPPLSEIPQGGKSALLGKQLKTVFVLRNLLRLPPEKLVEFLHKSQGSHPEEWITFCGDCEALVGEAFDLYEQQQRLQRKIKAVGQKLVGKVKEARNIIGHGGILEETRAFVRNHEYEPLENPFLAGDLEAECRAAVVKQEVDHLPLLQEEDSYSPPPSPTSPPVPSDGPSSALDKPDAFLTDSGRVHYRCPEPNCLRIITTAKGYASHQKTHRPRSPPPPLSSRLPCPISGCESTLPNRHRLGRHVRKVHKLDPRATLGWKKHKGAKPKPLAPGEQAHPCPVDGCNLEYGNARRLESHVRRIHNLSLPRVPQTQKRTRIRKRKPKEAEPPPREMRCKVTDCALVFSSVSEIWLHRRAEHAALFPLLCPDCSYCTNLKSSLDVHRKNRHGFLPPTTFPCEQCPQEFMSLPAVLCHRRQAHGQRRVRPLGAPQEPQKSRRTDRPKQCPQCGKMVKHMKSHLRHHDGQLPDRRVTCERCGHAATSNGKLIQHQARVHHICGVAECHQQFGSLAELHSHQVTGHGGQVDVFQCTEEGCGKLFITTTYLKTHKEQIHAKGVHVCEECGKGFSCAAYLKYHKNTTHQNIWGKNSKKRKPQESQTGAE